VGRKAIFLPKEVLQNLSPRKEREATSFSNTPPERRKEKKKGEVEKKNANSTAPVMRRNK